MENSLFSKLQLTFVKLMSNSAEKLHCFTAKVIFSESNYIIYLFIFISVSTQ